MRRKEIDLHIDENCGNCQIRLQTNSGDSVARLTPNRRRNSLQSFCPEASLLKWNVVDCCTRDTLGSVETDPIKKSTTYSAGMSMAFTSCFRRCLAKLLRATWTKGAPPASQLIAGAVDARRFMPAVLMAVTLRGASESTTVSAEDNAAATPGPPAGERLVGGWEPAGAARAFGRVLGVGRGGGRAAAAGGLGGRPALAAPGPGRHGWEPAPPAVRGELVHLKRPRHGAKQEPLTQHP